MSYLLHLIATIAVYVTLAQALNLALGYGGMLSLCSAALAGVGAYTSSLLMLHGGVSFFVALLAGASLAGLLALTAGRLSLRLRGDFFVLATMGVQAIASAVFLNWTSLTGGAVGLPGIPRPALPGGTSGPEVGIALLLVAMACGASLLVSRLSFTGFGRTLQAVRDNPLAAMALGKRPEYFRAIAFGLSGALSATGGAMYAVQMTYIDPTSFGLEESVLVFSMVVVGGSGSVLGPVVGATLLLLLPEVLRFVGVPDAVAPNLRQIIYGVLLLGMMFFRPRGIAGRFSLD